MIASTERYIREMPAQETGVPPDAVVSLAHARFQLAEAYNGASRWADALAACEFAAADIDPVRDRSWAPPCLMLLADLQQHSQQWDNVITTARRYIDFYPNEIAAGGMITLIGDAYAQKGAAGSAMAEFDRVLSQYPTSRELCANAMLDKGLLQETLGQIGEARQTLEQVVRTYPGTYPAVKARQQLALMGQ
jgi:tetratricopeptide (TPR) repeat protein